MTAGYQKIWSADPKLGFLAGADQLAAQLADGLVAAETLAQVRSQIFNLRLDAAITAFFMGLVALIVVDAMRVWLRRGGERLSPALERASG
jgi:carbon starvation protein